MAAASPQAEVRLDSAAAIRVSGADRSAFLQGQLTIDVNSVKADQPRFAGWASPKGRLLCTVWVCEWQDATWLILPAELAAAIAGRLRMYVLRARVQVELKPDAVRLLLPGDAIDSARGPEQNAQQLSFYPDGTGEPGLRLVCDAGQGVEHPAADALWRSANIRAGRPLILPATREEFVPQMVNLDLLGGISFSKGCYVGQEIVARTQNLGRIKRRMFRFLATTGSPAPGATVYNDGKQAGDVVDAVQSAGGWDLLAVISLDRLGTDLQLQPEGDSRLQRVPLPYPVPETPG